MRFWGRTVEISRLASLLVLIIALSNLCAAQSNASGTLPDAPKPAASRATAELQQQLADRSNHS